MPTPHPSLTKTSQSKQPPSYPEQVYFLAINQSSYSIFINYEHLTCIFRGKLFKRGSVVNSRYSFIPLGYHSLMAKTLTHTAI